MNVPFSGSPFRLFAFDGTKIDRLWDPQTGTVDFTQCSPERWQVLNGRFQEIIHENFEE